MRRGCLCLLLTLTLAAPTASAQRLLTLCQAALHSSPFLKLREYELDRARAEQDILRSRLLPQVVAQGSRTRNDYRDALVDEQQYSGQRAALTARLGLFDAPARHRHAASRESTLQREQELSFTRMALLGEVIDVYLKGLQAADEISSLDSEREAVRRQVDRLRVMRERQMAKVTDLAETEAYAQSLVTRAIDARNQVAQARARLTELTGLPVTHFVPLTQQRFESMTGSADDASGLALRNHPRLAALKHAVAAARRSLDGSNAEHLPQLSLVLSHTYTDQGFDNRRQPPYHASSIGIELRVPIYEGGRVNASAREALARVNIAEQQLEAARREIERETRASWGNAEANYARIGSTLQEVDAMAQTVRAQERGVELGASSVIDLLDARRRLMKAHADQAKARYDFIRDIVDLRIRSGELSESDLEVWDRWFDPTVR